MSGSAQACRAANEGTTARTDAVLVALTPAQTRWLTENADADGPAMSSSELVLKLVDDAIAESEAAARDRARQLEIYRASGYSEHHPDYPNPPRDGTQA